MDIRTRQALASLLSTLLANPDEEKPRLNRGVPSAKIASDIQYVMKMLRTEAA